MRGLTILGLALVVVAPAALEPAQDTTPGTGGRCAVRVQLPERAQRSDTTDPTPRRARRTFSAREILGVEFLARVRASESGEHHLVLKVFTPKNHLYQAISVPFESKVPERRGDRTARPRRGHSLRANLPVAGTSIVNNSLYGTWRVSAYLDGSQEPCGRAQRFVIEP